MNQSASELAVTLSPELYAALRSEAERLGLAIEWLIASLVVDTVESTTPAAGTVAA